MVKPLWKIVCRFLRKLQVMLSCHLAIPLPGIYPDKTIIQKDSHTLMFTAALFTTTTTWKPKDPLTDEGIKKMWYIYTIEYCAHVCTAAQSCPTLL